MNHHATKLRRVVLASAVILGIFIAVVFLSRSHKQLQLEHVLNNIEDKQFKECIREYAEHKKIQFAHHMIKLKCEARTDSQGEPLYIRSLAGISQLKDLKHLDIANAELKSMDELGYLKNLEYLALKNSKIVMIGDLIPLNKLRYLNLSGNEIVNASVIAHLINIEYLNLEGNYISNTAFLQPLANLTELNLKSNSLNSTEYFQNLAALRTLNLADNYISDVSALKYCRSLKFLDLSNNKLEDLSPLAPLVNLEEINLNNNRIQDLTPIAELLPKKLLLRDNYIREGVAKVFSALTNIDANGTNLNFKATIDLRLNRTINCEDLDQLCARLLRHPHVTIIRPANCIRTKRYKQRSKAKLNPLWHKFMRIF